MALAIELAKQGLYTTDPNPRVGALLVKNGHVIGKGAHLFAGEPHAEVYAIREATQAGHSLEKATAYVTLEPCSHYGKTPPCAEAIVQAGIRRVVIGMEDPNPMVSGRGVARLRDAGIQVDGPLLEQSVAQLNPGYIKRMTTGMPLVRCKMAMSVDGRTAMESGESKWITGLDARRDVQKWRARSSAVLTGIGTVRADDPSLNLRAEDLGWRPQRQPSRILLDSHLTVSTDAKIVSCQQGPLLEGPTVVVTLNHNSQEQEVKSRLLMDKGVEVITLEPSMVSGHSDSIPLKPLLSLLGEKGMNEVMLESGAQLAGAMLGEDLIDEMIIYMAPCIMGDSGKGLFHLPLLNQLRHKISLDIDSIQAVGKDWRIIASVKKCS